MVASLLANNVPFDRFILKTVIFNYIPNYDIIITGVVV